MADSAKINDQLSLLYSAEQIKEFRLSMVKQIHEYYAKNPGDLICIGVLKGAWLFLADLVRDLDIPCQIDFVWTSSYGEGTESQGQIKFLKDVETDFFDKNVLLVEEIIDSGRTLKFLKERLKDKKARDVKIASLLDKSSKRVVDIQADFVGKEIEDHFVVGYGLDWAEKYRDLNAIYKVSL